MRSGVTLLVIVGLLVLALAAAVDAIREEEENAAPQRPPRTSVGDAGAGTGSIAAALHEAGINGVVTYSDARCRLHAVRLPSFTPTHAPDITSCEPHIPTGGIGAWKGEVVWSGLGFRTIQVVLSREVLTRELQRHPNHPVFGPTGPRAYRAVQAVALSGVRYAVIVEGPRIERMLAVFRRGRAEFLLPPGWLGTDDTLRASPRGNYFAVLSTRPRGFRIFARDGGAVTRPEVGQPHAVAWSPDERWTALATPTAVHVFATTVPTRSIPLPISVRDLDWDWDT